MSKEALKAAFIAGWDRSTNREYLESSFEGWFAEQKFDPVGELYGRYELAESVRPVDNPRTIGCPECKALNSFKRIACFSCGATL